MRPVELQRTPCAVLLCCLIVQNCHGAFVPQLLDALDGLKRGVNATDADKARVEELVSALEKQNPNPRSLSSLEINGKWELLYTTSASVLGTNRPPFLRPFGPIYQFIGRER